MIITPDNILNMDIKEVLECVPEDFGSVIPLKNRVALAKMIYDVLGHELDNDGLLFAVSEPDIMICDATAGSGKTTSAQKKIILEKIYRKNPDGTPLEGSRILCLVYTKPNIQPMIDSHAKIVNKLYSRTDGLKIDRDIKACTLHSFCESWKNSYLAKCGMVNCTLLSDRTLNNLMRTCLLKSCYKYNIEEEKIVTKVKDSIALYNFKNERLYNFGDLEGEDNFIKLGVPLGLIEDTFTLFDNMKKLKRGYDYIDMLKSVLHLLETDTAVRERIQNYYQYICVDEIQDFTPLMINIVKLIKGKNVPLLCIGDDDQSIYPFKGAMVDCVKTFDHVFPNNKTFFLLKNRRCPSNMVDMAKEIISSIEDRRPRDIYSTNDDGIINLVKYHSQKGQLNLIINKLKAMSEEELNNTIVCYRNKKSSLLLSNMLLSENIDFNIISGYSPFSHELVTHYKNIYDLLAYPMDNNFIINLYKVLPCKRKDMEKLLGYNIKTNRYSNSGRTCFYDLNFGDLANIRDFRESLELLKKMSESLENCTMSDLYDGITYLLYKYFWNYKKFINGTEELDESFEIRCKEYFNIDMSYMSFSKKYDRDLDLIKKNERNKIGVTLSTFHGLKGLEIDNLIVMDLDEDIFPDFKSIDLLECGDYLKNSLKNCETRLFYVVCTRAKKKVEFYCSDNCSCYINIVKKYLSGRTNPRATSLNDVSKISDLKCFNNSSVNTSVLDRFK